ncbi:hypothetical protein FHS51_002570 [Sphingobium wenxiniae]|jgi:hypothetical protein|uniref:hypothetical protein n=1 Tax=Sphingobium wenxiniae (strain DSM 21828 / CGMCC 1.7748 / JZ-1) TaxID=595605 RepID=UPI0011A048E8|nr:hypothetical protein [Sphingobium wenxiniae]MBB6192327.1 hypothetical protein [Sphingobium wenxiniae]
MTAWLGKALRGGNHAALPYLAGRLCSFIVAKLTGHLASKLCSALCVALMLVFASASMANVVDRIQHQSSAASEHDHLAFSKIAFEVDDHHHDTQASNPDDIDDAPDGQPGTGHHHHVDGGSGLFTPVSHQASWLFSGASPWRPTVDDRMPGFLSHGPERPPKGVAIRI